MSESLVKLTIDGNELEVPQGTLLVDAAKKIGIDIPVFCYHPKLEPVGMCRMCLVEVGTPQFDREKGEIIRDENGVAVIQTWPKLATACTTPVSEGMVVDVQSEPAVEGRKQIVEYLLTSHPLDCPICDKGGECPLQNLTMAHGPGKSRFTLEDKMHLEKHVALGDLIFLDRERCIQCARCVRFQKEVVDDPVLAFAQRGRHLEIVTFSDPGFDSYFSGNTTDICPVGALTTADFRFGARPWELNTAASICPHCPVGCNLSLNTRREASSGGREVVKRVMPRQNEAVNEIWICDKGRFSHQFAGSTQRITHPLVRKDGEFVQVDWDEALEYAAEGLKTAGGKLLGLASGRTSNEDLFNFRSLITELGGNAVLYDSLAGGSYSGAYGVSNGTNIGEFTSGDAILVVASDLHEEAPIWWLRVKQAAERGATVVVVNARPTRLDAFASYRFHAAYGRTEAAIVALINASLGEEVDAVVVDAEAMTAAGKALAKATNLIVFYGGEGMGYAGSESLVRACMRLMDETGHVGRENNGLIPVWPRCNTQGAWDIGLRPTEEGLLSELESATGAYVMAADPAGDDPKFAEKLHGEIFLVVQDLFLTPTAELADVLLPAQSFIEREGTYTSGERRVQRFYPALPRQGEALPDWGIVARLAEKLGIEMSGSSAAGVFAAIAESIPVYRALDYASLAHAPAQWPDVGGADGFFGGTSYRNNQGVGVQLPHDAQDFNLIEVAIEPQQLEVAADQVLLVPVTYLYDRGTLNQLSEVLRPRLAPVEMRIHPDEARKIGAADGADVEIRLNGTVHKLPVNLDKDVPEGVAIIGHSQGVPIRAPAVVKVNPVLSRGAE
jgi:NADH-quinone oxidoreductase subunit G